MTAMKPPLDQCQSAFRRNSAATYCSGHRCDLFHLIARALPDIDPARDVCILIAETGRCPLLHGADLLPHGTGRRSPRGLWVAGRGP